MEYNKKTLIKFLEKNEGGTLDLNLKPIAKKSGYMVSYASKEFTTCDTNEVYDKVLEYRDYLEKTNKKNAFVGVWLDAGTWYVDISKHFNDLKSAKKFGLVNKQLAIFNLATFESINLEYTEFLTIYDAKMQVIAQVDSITQVASKLVELFKGVNINMKSLYNSVNSGRLYRDMVYIYKDRILKEELL